MAGDQGDHVLQVGLCPALFIFTAILLKGQLVGTRQEDKKPQAWVQTIGQLLLSTNLVQMTVNVDFKYQLKNPHVGICRREMPHVQSFNSDGLHCSIHKLSDTLDTQIIVFHGQEPETLYIEMWEYLWDLAICGTTTIAKKLKGCQGFSPTFIHTLDDQLNFSTCSGLCHKEI
jgi:hypothetical protein